MSRGGSRIKENDYLKRRTAWLVGAKKYRFGLDDRAVSELMGLASGVIADGVFTQKEAKFIQKWILSNVSVFLQQNPIITPLLVSLNQILSDKVLDKEESAELLDTLSNLSLETLSKLFFDFSLGGFKLGEMRESTSAFFDSPFPEIELEGKVFCFTGTFAYGGRKECERIVKNNGGSVDNLTRKTDYLVVGIYATDLWLNSSLGHKLKKSVMYRDKYGTPAIVSEEEWVGAIQQRAKELIDSFFGEGD